MIVVVDTGPLLHLQETQCLDLLNLTGDIHIPSAVCKIWSKAHSDSGVSRTPIPEHAAH